MRVAVVPHAYAPSVGGAQTYARGLAEGLARLGHEVVVLAPDVADPEAFYELGHGPVGQARELISGVMVHRLPYASFRYRRGGRPGGLAPALESSRRRFGRLLARAIEDVVPDVVFTLPHLFPNVDEVVRLRRGASWKLVYAPMLHEEDPYWSVERVAAAVAGCDGAVALTDHERDRLLESYGAVAARTAVVPPGVEVPESPEGGEREPAVLVLGRRAASKRLDVVYQAMLEVWPSRPDARLVIAGPAPPGATDPARAFAGDPRVEVRDEVSRQERERLLERASLLVGASRIESFGVTILEAWAHRLPVVVVDTPVSRSVVRDGIDGLVAPDSPDAVGRAVAMLLSDRPLAVRMGSAGRHRVEEEFTWPAVSSRMERLLLSL